MDEEDLDKKWETSTHIVSFFLTGHRIDDMKIETDIMQPLNH